MRTKNLLSSLIFHNWHKDTKDSISKKIKFIFTIFFILAHGFLFGQNNYYWYNNKKIHLEIIQDKKFVLFTGNVNDKFNLKQVLNNTEIEVLSFTETSVSPAIIPYNNNLDILSGKKSAVIQKNDLISVNFSENKYVIYESPFYRFKGSKSEAGLSYLFYVKLFHEDDLIKLEELSQEHSVNILGNNKFMPLWFTLSCSKQSTGNALEMANLFYETGLFSATEPDLIIDWALQSVNNECVNDEYFYKQWGLKNTVEYGGIIGIDINVCKAWEITQGDENIIVAVIDNGIMMQHCIEVEEGVECYGNNHEDLQNMYPDSYYNWDEGPSKESQHGTNCAGIIGASKNNDIGIAGIAPNCPLMSISGVGKPYWEPVEDYQQRIADAINWAWENGASVISNSWGTEDANSTIVDDAITAALTQGRNELGCVVVFSSGNNNSPNSIYPANSNPLILNVGAIDKCGVRSGRIDVIPQSCDPWPSGYEPGSGYGSTLDVVAPGTNISTTGLVTDHPYYSEYYIHDFSGTSAAAPHVAGVAALILSVNPNLTVQEVNNIIESTAQKISDDLYEYEENVEGRPNGTWNNKLGYGLVDAYAALLEACIQEFYISWDIEENETLHYKASETIIANNIIESGADATYQAGNRIVLQHGFHAKQGSKFHAYIAPCEIGGGTKMLITDNNAPPHIGRTDNNIKEREDEIPADIEQPDYKYIFSAYPNPFDNSTIITFSVSEPSYINIYITNTDGQHVHQLHNKFTEAGNYELKLDGTALQPGVYFCVMETMAGREVIKVVKM